MINAISQFRDAIRSAGLQPPDIILLGKLHRFPGIGKRRGNTAAWCKLFDDGLGGSFGDWSTGISENWKAKRDKAFSYTECTASKRRVEEARTKAEIERKEKYAEAAERAREIWNSAEPAMFHEYLKQKRILPLGIKIDQYNNLLVPLLDGREIQSLQIIQPDGTKRFLKGGKTKGMYYSIELKEQPEKLIICEGFATGATLYMETKIPVIVAFYAANLVPVAKAFRRQYRKAEILICGDDDRATDGNPGHFAAKAAARACGGGWSIPDFTCFNPTPKDTDFNDLYLLQRAGK